MEKDHIIIYILKEKLGLPSYLIPRESQWLEKWGLKLGEAWKWPWLEDESFEDENEKGLWVVIWMNKGKEV